MLNKLKMKNEELIDFYCKKNNNKKEVFLLEGDYEILELYRTLQFGRYSKIKRNDICLCGSGKKYKRCCINKVQKCEKMYSELASKNKYQYRISDKLIAERNL